MVGQLGGTEEAFAAMADPAGSHEFFMPEEFASTILDLAPDASAHLNGVEIVITQGHVA